MQPSWLAKLFTGCGDWTLSADSDSGLVSVSVNGSAHKLDISQLTVGGGLFWGSVSGEGFTLKGVSKSNVTALKELAVQAWYAISQRNIQNAFAKHGWITFEERDAIISSRPTSRGINEYHLSRDHPEAFAFWKTDIAWYVRDANENFTKKQLVGDAEFFKTAEKSPLTEEQARAVLCFENKTMLVASAGSGKTSVIVAKAAYAIYKGYFRPNEILILAFNKKAAEEVQERIRKRLEFLGFTGGVPTVQTFHAFSLAVIGMGTGRKPSVPPWVEHPSLRNSVLNEIVSRLRETDAAFKAEWPFFAGFLIHETNIPSDNGSYYTQRGEFVKSRAEQMLANWLHYMGVNYAYEQKYLYPTADKYHKQYTPDFYLPDAGIYIELWALGDNDPEPEKFRGYKEGMRWKRDLHRRHGTKLAEVTAREVWNGIAFDKLKRLFTEIGLPLLPGSNKNEKREELGDTDSKSLVFTFMAHVKNGRLTKEALEDRCQQHDCGVRGEVFLRLFWKIYDAWQEKLRDSGCVDFDDMTGMGVEILRSSRWNSPYKLVMADEFQDTSAARADLLQALTAAHGHHLFVVGDDWQGINRFAGSDLSVMTRFEEKFGEATILKLETTFRFPQTMCDIMGGFVLKNKSQLRKKVKSVAALVTKPVLLHSANRYMILAVQKALTEIAKNGKASVLILGRYKFDRELVPDKTPTCLSVDFMTVHSAKGREADYVIIPNVNDARLGFPSQVEDDPLLDMCSPEAEPFQFAEERRLFYVAVTRARKQAYVIGESGKLSPFIVELAKDFELPIITTDGKEERFCPKCKKGLLVRRNSERGPFWGCSLYPKCRFIRDAREKTPTKKDFDLSARRAEETPKKHLHPTRPADAFTKPGPCLGTGQK